MSESIFVWEVSVCKGGITEPFEKLYFIAANFFQLSHLAAAYIFGDDEHDGMYDFQVEITSMVKVQGVGKIVNADFNMDGDDDDEESFDLSAPLDITHANAELIAEFKCSCMNKVKVDVGFDWPATRCPHCNRLILRRDISEIKGTGIWAYTPSNGEGK